jgi:hypothetical protein
MFAQLFSFLKPKWTDVVLRGVWTAVHLDSDTPLSHDWHLPSRHSTVHCLLQWPQAAGTSFRCTSCTCSPTTRHFNLTTDLISCAESWCLFSNYCCRLTKTSLTLPIPARRKSNYKLRDYRLPPQLKRIIPSSGLLCGVRWFDTGVSGLPIGPSSRVNLSKKLNHRAPRNNPEDGRIQTIGRLWAVTDKITAKIRWPKVQLHLIWFSVEFCLVTAVNKFDFTIPTNRTPKHGGHEKC